MMRFNTRTPGFALISISAIMALAVVGTSLSIDHSVRMSSRDLIRAQALALVEHVRARLRFLSDTIHPDDLAVIIDDLADQGLRFIALEPKSRLSSGTPLIRSIMPTSHRPIAWLHHGNRVRVHVNLPLHGRRRRPLFRSMRWPPPPFRVISNGLSLEFEPTLANQLQSRARRNLTIAAIVAVLLMMLAFRAAQWMRQQATLEKQLTERRRLASLGEMSAVLAHEIRNPLASLKGHAQLLQEDSAPDTATYSKVRRVVKEAQRLEQLVNELLEFVRDGVIDRSSADPVGLLRTIVDEMSIRVVIDSQHAPDTWVFDAQRIRRALANVLQNASQAAPSGSHIDVVVREISDTLEWVIRDHGHGIASGNEERIFEPFHTGRTRGTGLGLAVARRLVEAHGGRLTATNATGGGAIFTLSLPREGEPSHA